MQRSNIFYMIYRKEIVLYACNTNTCTWCFMTSDTNYQYLHVPLTFFLINVSSTCQWRYQCHVKYWMYSSVYPNLWQVVFLTGLHPDSIICFHFLFLKFRLKDSAVSFHICSLVSEISNTYFFFHSLESLKKLYVMVKWNVGWRWN